KCSGCLAGVCRIPSESTDPQGGIAICSWWKITPASFQHVQGFANRTIHESNHVLEFVVDGIRGSACPLFYRIDTSTLSRLITNRPKRSRLAVAGKREKRRRFFDCHIPGSDRKAQRKR